jgi:hypothetical protein
MWEFMRAWNHIEPPSRLLQYRDLIYPQCEEKFRAISRDTWAYVQQEAAKQLAKYEREPVHTWTEEDGTVTTVEAAHPAVVAHWRSIVAGAVPFGLRVEDER